MEVVFQALPTSHARMEAPFSNDGILTLSFSSCSLTTPVRSFMSVENCPPGGGIRCPVPSVLVMCHKLVYVDYVNG